MAEFFLPVLSHFQNGNPWTGSLGRLRYRIVPAAAQQETDGRLTAEVWEGPWAYEFSQVEDTALFPLSPEGLEELARFLSHWRDQVNTRPERTLAENMARRQEPASKPE